MKFFLYLFVFFGCTSFTFIGKVMSKYEEPKYSVLQSKGNIEIRKYFPMILAEIEIAGIRKQILNKGFEILAYYLSGGNYSKKEVAITTSAWLKPGEKIAMTAPVMQQAEGNRWKIQFVMPSSYTLETLPAPKFSSIQIVETSFKNFAVIRFSGLAGDESLLEHTKQLQTYLKENKLESIGNPIYAFYNPPWTLPFLRRNEILIELAASFY